MPDKARRGMSPLLRFLLKLAVVAAVVLISFTFVLGLHIYHGNRMYPFIMDGDLLITYKLDAYREGDVVLYKNPLTGESTVSRIVAMGANEIEITITGEVLVNGFNSSVQEIYPTYEFEGSGIKFPYTMGEDGILLLDDNREAGIDSRVYGEVRKEAIKGKVVYVLRRRGF